MISQEKWMILTPLQKLPNYVGELGKIIFSTSFELLPKVHKIAQSGHTGANPVVQLISWAVKAYLTAWPQNWIFVAFSSEKTLLNVGPVWQIKSEEYVDRSLWVVFLCAMFMQPAKEIAAASKSNPRHKTQFNFIVFGTLSLSLILTCRYTFLLAHI